MACQTEMPARVAKRAMNVSPAQVVEVNMPDEQSTSGEPKFQAWMVNYALNERLRVTEGAT
jgi:hypothetical protein